MSYAINPKSDEELDSFDLMDDGVYNFAVEKSERKTSKGGNPMAQLKLTVWDNAGKPHGVFDFLVFSDVNLCIKKVKRFCQTTGIENEYLGGNIREDMEGLAGKCRIITQDAQPKDGGGTYPKKNIVDEYIYSKADAAKAADAKEPFLDDDIPF